jgi:hypothetical protein
MTLGTEWNADRENVAAMTSRIQLLLNRTNVSCLVALYFDPSERFAGLSFDHRGLNPPDEITGDDLLAVTLLDVGWRPLGIRQLDDRRAQVAERLGRIGDEVCLWDADAATLSEADGLLDLVQVFGSDWVMSSKLLARKRPALVPIADSVIFEALRPPEMRFWATLRGCLQDPHLREGIDALRPEHLTASQVSTLRVLDVVAWMFHSRSKNATRARRRCGVPEPG